MAERARFELAISLAGYAGFQDQCHQPLGHLSQKIIAIAALILAVREGYGTLLNKAIALFPFNRASALLSEI